MRFYTVHLKPDADEPVLVREGFSWGAVLLGPVWLLAHRAWVPAALSLAAFLLIGTLPGDPARFLLGSALALLLGLSGNDIRRWGLEQRGYALVHVYAARDSEEALLRLLNERTDVAARYRAATA